MSETTTSPTRDEDDLATLLAKREHARPNRLTWALLALLLVTAGFAGGALAYERFGPTQSSGLPDFASGGLPDFASGGLPGGMPGTGSAGGATGGAADASTQGTVKLVDGDTVYVATGDDAVVIVTVPTDASVTRQKAIDLSDLAIGSTVTVIGEAGTDGKVTAASVSEDAGPMDSSSTTTPTKE